MISLKFVFKKLTKQDFKLLFSWTQAQSLWPFWRDETTWQAFEEKYTKKLAQKSFVTPFLVYFDGKPFGYIQYWKAAEVGEKWLPDKSIGVIGIDQYIGDPELWGKGFGTEMIKQFCRQLFDDTSLGVTKIIVDPLVINERAIACYEKIGFLKVKHGFKSAKNIGDFLAKYDKSVELMELTREMIK